jgi:hypothetical protein
MMAKTAILSFVSKALSGLRKIVYRRPDAPAHDCTVLKESSLHDLSGALHRAKMILDETFECSLCALEKTERERLCRIMGLLPVGFVVQLPVISAITGEKFGAVTADLNFLTYRLGFPIKNLKPGYLLTSPIQLCPRCVEIGEQLWDTPIFKKRFKASPRPKTI